MTTQLIHRPAGPPRPVTSVPEPSRYVTDGLNLFRLLGPVGDVVDGGVVPLEDCRSLDVVLLPVDDFLGATLRPVRPAADPR